MNKLLISQKPSDLLGALRRIGGQIKQLEDVEGTFTPTSQIGGRRVYGVLQSHDAQVRVGFDAAKVSLPPPRPCRMVLSGKLWLDERNSALTVMVRYYRVLDDNIDTQSVPSAAGVCAAVETGEA